VPQAQVDIFCTFGAFMVVLIAVAIFIKIRLYLGARNVEQAHS
jgi:hypothetical protein